MPDDPLNIMSGIEKAKAGQRLGVIGELRQDYRGIVAGASAVRERMIRAARVNINAFIELVMKDDQTGERIIQSPLHESWHQFMGYCRAIGRNCGIMAPFEFGKSIQGIGLCLYLIGRYPEIRIKVVSNRAKLAMQRVQAVRRYIDHDDDYHAVFPHIVPVKGGGAKGSGEEWTGASFRVRSGSFAADSTMEAFGVGSVVAGGRVDFLWVDDPLDLENAVHKGEAMRPKITSSITEQWSGRVVHNGMQLMTTTPYHEEDVTAALRKNTEWGWMVQGVAEDFGSIDSTITLAGLDTIDLPPLPWAA